jgi:hypothetical protein
MKRSIGILMMIFASTFLLRGGKAYASGLSLSEELLRCGYHIKEIEAMKEADKKEILDAYKNNELQKNTVYLEVDNLSEIEKLCYYSEEELLNMGCSLNQIRRAKNEIDSLYSIPEEELCKKLKTSRTQTKLFKKAVESGKSRKKKVFKEGVSSSSTISSSKLKFTMSVVDRSSVTAPEYKVILTYVWSEPYFLGLFEDAVVAAWSGGLNTKSQMGLARYSEYIDYGVPFGNSFGSFLMSKVEDPGKGVEFYFDQHKTIQHRSAKTESGSIDFVLFQTKKSGLSGKIIAQYGHRTIAWGASVGISAQGPTVDISFSSAYDTSSQCNTNIIY